MERWTESRNLYENNNVRRSVIHIWLTFGHTMVDLLHMVIKKRVFTLLKLSPLERKNNI